MKTKKTTGRSGPSTHSVDLKEVERLLGFMKEHGVEEFEYARGDFHIRLRKPGMNPGMAVPLSPERSQPGLGSAPEIVVAGAEAASASSSAAQPAAGEAGELFALSEANLHVVKSPIVGTFYEAPSPGAEPLVQLGDQVRAGQVLCIIEAMKLMNEIESDAAGEIVRIYPENGQPVEYGQPLFAIRPTHKK